MAIAPFPYPRVPWDEHNGPAQIRGELNTLAKAISGFETINVSTAHAIFPAVANSAAGWVNGDDGSGNAFADQVAWNGTTNTKAVISSTTIAGTPAARTYTVVSGVLKVAMAAGTYTIVCVPVIFTS